VRNIVEQAIRENYGYNAVDLIGDMGSDKLMPRDMPRVEAQETVQGVLLDRLKWTFYIPINFEKTA
jgi:hypothetical protein